MRADRERQATCPSTTPTVVIEFGGATIVMGDEGGRVHDFCCENGVPARRSSSKSGARPSSDEDGRVDCGSGDRTFFASLYGCRLN